MLEYSLLHLFGYGLSIDELKNFRQWGSKTPGHPEFGHTVGVVDDHRPAWAGNRQPQSAWRWRKRGLAAEF
jgi:hypothetical protein